MTSKLASKSNSEYQRILSHLIRLRQAAGLSQGDLADKLGWSRATVRNIEDFKRRLDPVEFHQYCRVTGQDDAELIKDLAE